jgi:hypothetical protein
MRTTKKLLYLVKQTVQEERVQGICSAVSFLWARDIILVEEYAALNKFLQARLPEKKDYFYCWEKYEKEPRIRWLDEQILLLESYGVE